MNATNRAVNRGVLLVVGLILLAAGGAAFVAIIWRPAGQAWQDGVGQLREWLIAADEGSRLHPSTTVSWVTLGLLLVLLAIVVFAVVTVARLGGGRVHTVTRVEGDEGAIGPVTVTQGFVADALNESLSRHEGILSTKVSASRVRGEDVLHVSVTPRQNVSPARTAATVAGLLDNLGTLLGERPPTYISIHAGLRAKLAADQPRVR